MDFNPNNYLSLLQNTLAAVEREKISRLASKLEVLRGTDRTLFLAGNGGSAATASHAACDLSKTIAGENRKAIRAICLNDNVPLLTAWANDSGYKEVFSGQLKNLGQKGDMFIAISASGNSENILEALAAAKQMGMETFGFLGFDGGKAKSLADDFLLVPVQDFGIVEDIHMIIFHMITDYFKKLS